MGIYSTKSKWQLVLRPFVTVCVRKRIHPDWFTYSALVFSFVAAFALWRAGVQRWWLWLAPPCMLMRLALNLMDGQVARELGLDDPWGEVKNEFGDRIADVAIFLGISFGGYADVSLVTLALAMILCVSYLGVFGKALGGPRVYGGIFGKGDRMISLAVFTLYPLLSGNLESINWYLVFASVAAVITILQRLRTIHGYEQPDFQ
jgi:CDP-diacylglycerol--glycerol-3-phosphate 3-phosphatidyltransferase